MLKIINTSGQIDDLFDKGAFSRDKWREYINLIYEDSSHLFEDEVEEYIASGEYTFEKDFLPVIQAVFQNPKRDILQQSFLAVTDHLNERISQTFHRGIDADLVLYLGLCNAAG